MKPTGKYWIPFYNILEHQEFKPVLIHLNGLNKCISLIDEKLACYREKYVTIIGHLVTMTSITAEFALYIFGEIGLDMFIWTDTLSLLPRWISPRQTIIYLHQYIFNYKSYGL